MEKLALKLLEFTFPFFRKLHRNSPTKFLGPEWQLSPISQVFAPTLDLASVRVHIAVRIELPANSIAFCGAAISFGAL